MKKRWLIAVLLFCAVFAFGGVGFFGGSASAADGQLKVVATECFVYQTASFDQQVLLEDGSPLVLKHGDMVTKAQSEMTSDKFEFVAFGEKQGWVFKYYLTSNLTDQVVYPVFNARVVTDQAQVFDLQGQPTPTKLERGKEIYLYEGYKSSNDGFTPICFVDEQGGLYYGFLRTKDLEPYGINGWVITGIVAAASCITIILLLIFMKKKKTKKAER